MNFRPHRFTTVISVILSVILASCSCTNEKISLPSKNVQNSNEAKIVATTKTSEKESLEYFNTYIFEEIKFGFDTDIISNAQKVFLDKQIDWLLKNYGFDCLIEGHCDEKGTREYNLALGDRRAQSVKNYMVSCGVESGRLQTVSYGKEKLASPGHDELNRRTILNPKKRSE